MDLSDIFCIKYFLLKLDLLCSETKEDRDIFSHCECFNPERPGLFHLTVFTRTWAPGLVWIMSELEHQLMSWPLTPACSRCAAAIIPYDNMTPPECRRCGSSSCQACNGRHSSSKNTRRQKRRAAGIVPRALRALRKSSRLERDLLSDSRRRKAPDFLEPRVSLVLNGGNSLSPQHVLVLKETGLESVHFLWSIK